MSVRSIGLRWREIAAAGLMTVVFAATGMAPVAAQEPEITPPAEMGSAKPLHECSAPPNPLPENWTCVDALPPPPPLPSELQRQLPGLAPMASSDFCAADGVTCWHVTDDFRARFYTPNIRFMKGPTQVGSASMEIEWTLEGNGTFIDLWRVTPSVTTSSIFFLASLYNGAEGVGGGGSELDFKMFSNQSTVTAGTPRTCSCSSRAVLRDDQNYDHNARAEFSVSIPNQNGFWYYYVRSLVAHRDGPPNGQATIYRFRPADHLPVTPTGVIGRSEG
jgi:hypothetical protein